jgi:hypothetical protein
MFSISQYYAQCHEILNTLRETEPLPREIIFAEGKNTGTRQRGAFGKDLFAEERPSANLFFAKS